MPIRTYNPDANGRVIFYQPLKDDEGNVIDVLDVRLMKTNGVAVSAGFERPEWLEYTEEESTVGDLYTKTLWFDLPENIVAAYTSLEIEVDYRDREQAFPMKTDPFLIEVVAV